MASVAVDINSMEHLWCFDRAVVSLAEESGYLAPTFRDSMEIVAGLLENPDLVQILRAIGAHSDWLLGHSVRVTLSALTLAQQMELDVDLDEFARACILHDCGKVWIPPKIVNKPGSLTREERSLMESHPDLGRYVLDFYGIRQTRLLLDVVTQHHERMDGKGYPRGLEGSEVPLAVQIVSVCDAYDAMVSSRCYGSVKTPEMACQELRREGHRQFNATVANHFVQLVQASPEAPWAQCDRKD